MTRGTGALFLVTTMLLTSVGVVACERADDLPDDQPAVEPAVDPAGATPPAEGGVLPAAPEGGVMVSLIAADGRHAGGARLEEVAEGVRVSLRITGLSEGEHGLHFHEAGRCDPSGFESAGAHFSPHERQHGFLNPQGPHAGDLPNIRAGADGVADTSFVATTVRLSASAAEGLLRSGGTALVVHAGPDDYRTDPSGNSGDRIACGVVRRD